jgi:hypothetical protein
LFDTGGKEGVTRSVLPCPDEDGGCLGADAWACSRLHLLDLSTGEKQRLCRLKKRTFATAASDQRGERVGDWLVMVPSPLAEK